jgi:hypothetical protein
MPEGLCPWYILEKGLLKEYLDERGHQYKFYCNDDTQDIIVHYLQCVKLDEIADQGLDFPSRLEKIRTWATPDRLRRACLAENEQGQHILDIHHHRIPDLSRYGRFPSISTKKFEITDGRHRIQRAKELGIDCILADIEEDLVVHRSDTDFYESR